MTLLRELLLKASVDLGKYMQPDVAEATQKVKEIVAAGNLGLFLDIERITDISIGRDDGGMVCITTWCRSYITFYQFPVSIIDDEDPIYAATVYGLQKKIDYNEHELRMAQAQVDFREKEVFELSVEMAKVKARKAVAA